MNNSLSPNLSNPAYVLSYRQSEFSVDQAHNHWMCRTDSWKKYRFLGIFRLNGTLSWNYNIIVIFVFVVVIISFLLYSLSWKLLFVWQRLDYTGQQLANLYRFFLWCARSGSVFTEWGGLLTEVPTSEWGFVCSYFMTASKWINILLWYSLLGGQFHWKRRHQSKEATQWRVFLPKIVWYAVLSSVL